MPIRLFSTLHCTVISLPNWGRNEKKKVMITFLVQYILEYEKLPASKIVLLTFNILTQSARSHFRIK